MPRKVAGMLRIFSEGWYLLISLEVPSHGRWRFLFWGKWQSKVTVWLLAVGGAFTTALPRIFPPLAAGEAERFAIESGASAVVIGFGALAVLVGATLKEIDVHIVKKGAAGVLERAANAVTDLQKQLPRMVGKDSSKERQERVIEAAQHCALRLLDESGKNMRVTFYQLEYDEARQAADSSPGTRPIEQARLILVGDPLGRGNDPARQEFKHDNRGKETLIKILGKEEIWCPDARREASKKRWPRPRYRAYISVPIVVEGEVEGMLSCDSLVRRELKRSAARLIQIPASFVGTELRALERGSQPLKPSVQ